MTTEVKEQSSVDELRDRGETSVFGFIGRFAVTHTVVYFIAGMIFSILVNYRELFATAAYSYMRPFDHPLVILGPLLNLFRGALLAVAFVPFRKVIVGSKRGWVYLFSALWILTNVGADAADPGKIEGFIYGDYSFGLHLATLPEFTFHSLALAWIFHTWERNPKDKRVYIPLIAGLAIVVVVAILGLLFTPPA